MFSDVTVSQSGGEKQRHQNCDDGGDDDEDDGDDGDDDNDGDDNAWEGRGRLTMVSCSGVVTSIRF